MLGAGEASSERLGWNFCCTCPPAQGVTLLAVSRYTFRPGSTHSQARTRAYRAARNLHAHERGESEVTWNRHGFREDVRLQQTPGEPTTQVTEASGETGASFLQQRVSSVPLSGE